MCALLKNKQKQKTKKPEGRKNLQEKVAGHHRHGI